MNEIFPKLSLICPKPIFLLMESKLFFLREQAIELYLWNLRKMQTFPTGIRQKLNNATFNEYLHL